MLCSFSAVMVEEVGRRRHHREYHQTYHQVHLTSLLMLVSRPLHVHEVMVICAVMDHLRQDRISHPVHPLAHCVVIIEDCTPL